MPLTNDIATIGINYLNKAVGFKYKNKTPQEMPSFHLGIYIRGYAVTSLHQVKNKKRS